MLRAQSALADSMLAALSRKNPAPSEAKHYLIDQAKADHFQSMAFAWPHLPRPFRQGFDPQRTSPRISTASTDKARPRRNQCGYGSACAEKEKQPEGWHLPCPPLLASRHFDCSPDCHARKQRRLPALAGSRRKPQFACLRGTVLWRICNLFQQNCGLCLCAGGNKKATCF